MREFARNTERPYRNANTGSGAGFNAVAEKRIDLAYNALGQFTGVSRTSNLAGTAVVATSNFSYDSLARLTGLAHRRADNSSINTYAWTFDSLNRIDTFSSSDGTTDFNYDVTSQLTSANHSYQTDENYTYDLNGNRLENGQVTGADNRLLNDGTFTYEYDAEGNRTLRENIADGTTTEYAWDHRNRLTLVTFKSAAGAVTKRVAYTYDVFDHRIGKQVDDNGDGGFDRFERYVWDGLDVVLDFVDADGDGPGQYALQTRRVFGPAVDQVLAEEDAATSAVDWLLADNQGTVRDVVDSAGQLVSGGHFVFDSFGKVISGDASLIRHLYTGQEFDADLNLYYYNARWYDPATHTFISVDPIKDGRNWYAYVSNNSPNATDPSGLVEQNRPPSAYETNPSGGAAAGAPPTQQAPDSYADIEAVRTRAFNERNQNNLPQQPPRRLEDPDDNDGEGTRELLAINPNALVVIGNPPDEIWEMFVQSLSEDGKCIGFGGGVLNGWRDIAAALERVPDGSIGDLVIVGHGVNTGAAIRPDGNPDEVMSVFKLSEPERADIVRLIRRKLSPNARIIFGTCHSATNSRNDRDLLELAKLTGHPVVGANGATNITSPLDSDDGSSQLDTRNQQLYEEEDGYWWIYYPPGWGRPTP